YIVDASPNVSPSPHPNPSGGRAAMGAPNVTGASPLPILPPTPLGTGFSNPSPGSSGAQAYQEIAAALGNPPSPGRPPYSSAFGPPASFGSGGSRSQPYTASAGQSPDAQLTYRAGEISRLRSSQSSKSSQTTHEKSGPSLTDSAVRMLAMRKTLPMT